MSSNLLSLAQETLGSDFSKLAGSMLGETPGATQSALASLLPAVLGSIAQKGSTQTGASGLLSLIDGARLDPDALGNLAGLFGGSGANQLAELATSRLLPALFGDRTGALADAVSSASGIGRASATKLVALVVGLVLTFLKRFVGARGLDARSLSTLLSGQGANLQDALDGRITRALGYATPAALLSGLGGQAADAARRVGATGAAATAATTSGLKRWLPWAVALALPFLLWRLFASEPAATPDVAARPPSAALADFPAKVYFETGSAAVDAESGAAITAAAMAIREGGLRVALTGYTDRTGDVARNEELAKGRADAVREALVAAGVAATDIEMRPPLFVEIGESVSDADARRVDIDVR